jgi:hypothetical protein
LDLIFKNQKKQKTNKTNKTNRTSTQGRVPYRAFMDAAHTVLGIGHGVGARPASVDGESVSMLSGVAGHNSRVVPLPHDGESIISTATSDWRPYHGGRAHGDTNHRDVVEQLR